MLARFTSPPEKNRHIAVQQLPHLTYPALLQENVRYHFSNGIELSVLELTPGRFLDRLIEPESETREALF